MTNEKQAKETMRMRLLQNIERYNEEVHAQSLLTAKDAAKAQAISEIVANLAAAYAALCTEV